jgi:hypothetical protein
MIQRKKEILNIRKCEKMKERKRERERERERERDSGGV